MWVPPPETLTTRRAPVSTGSLVLSTLLDKEWVYRDPVRSWFAAVLVGLLLDGNPDTKALALRYRVGLNRGRDEQGPGDDGQDEDEADGEGAITLLPCLVHSLMTWTREVVDQRVLAGLYGLLILWLADHQPSCEAYLSDSSHVSFVSGRCRPFLPSIY
jgi:hypothetical protein